MKQKWIRIQVVKTYDFYKDIADDIKKWFDTFNYDEKLRKRLLSVGKNIKMIGLMRDERWGKIITKFATTAPKTLL